MSRYFILAGMAMVVAGALSSSCASDSAPLPETEKASASFYVGLDTQSRAAQSLNLATYDAKMYLYEGTEDENGSVGYSQVREVQLTDNQVTVDDLNTGRDYKAVFLAVPKGQQPGLPSLYTTDIVPAYNEAVTQYINGQENETDKQIFRSVLSFRPSVSTSTQSTVLTRQNGALEVRIKNKTGMTSVKLCVKGHKAMYLHDGTGGQVITSGGPVPLSAAVTEGLEASEIRVRIHLLPQEDVTDAAGTDNYLEIVTGSGTTRYPIRSDHQTIPIYPNQVTWLTLGDGSGNFTVGFSGKMNLEDEEWDGWMDNN